MADIRRIGREETIDVGPRPAWVLVGLAAVYWLIAGGVAFVQYKDAYQTQVHRIEDLKEKGLLTSDRRLDRARMATLAAEAVRNNACFEAHPAPPGQVGPWTPADCDPYLPREADADAADAVFAANNPRSSVLAGQLSASRALRVWALGFLPLAAVALLVAWIIGRIASARPEA
jgi:hypothetical protein